MYDPLLETRIVELVGSSSDVLWSDSDLKYITAVTIQQSKDASTTDILCGSTVVARNYGKDLSQINMIYKCEFPISVNKTGQDDSFIYVNITRTDIENLEFNYTVVEESSASAVAWHGSVWIQWISFGLILFVLYTMLGIWLFRK